MHVFWGALIILAGLFMAMYGRLRSESFIYRLIVARSRILWGDNVYRFHQIAGGMMVIFGVLLALRCFWPLARVSLFQLIKWKVISYFISHIIIRTVIIDLIIKTNEILNSVLIAKSFIYSIKQHFIHSKHCIFIPQFYPERDNYPLSDFMRSSVQVVIHSSKSKWCLSVI